MNNRKSNQLKRMAIAAVCVGMVGSGGLVQAMNTAKPVSTYLKTGKVTPVMTAMINVPASKIASVPLGKNDKITRVNLPNFQIGKVEVTGALWGYVYNWAITRGYTFTNTGKHVGTDKPVTNICWYDAIVWTNAYSEKSGLDPVYRDGEGKVLKDARDTEVLDQNEKRYNGYRLLGEQEWEIAARWLGTKKPMNGMLETQVIATKGRGNKTTYYWTPGDYASGAIENIRNKNETARVAWYGRAIWQNWFDQESAQKVCTKAPNTLGICDMSGNIWEYIFQRGVRGGSRNYDIKYVTVSGVYSIAPTHVDKDNGFRLARTVK